jgi:hypothetical protein
VSRYAIITAMIIAGPAPAEDPQLRFEGFTSQAGRFSVDLPRKPTETTETDASRDAHIFTAGAAGPVLYRLEYVDPRVGVALKYPDTPQGLKANRDAYHQGLRVYGDQEITLGPKKVPGREYRMDLSDGAVARMRLYRSGNRLYLVQVVAKDKAVLDSAAANHFFDSFMINPGAPLALTFEKVAPAGGNFCAQMPGRPTEKTTKNPDWTMHEFTVVAAEQADFSVFCVDFPAGSISKARSPQEWLVIYRRSSNLDRQVEGEKEITLGPEKVPGREYTVPSLLIHERVFLKGDRVYSVQVRAWKREFLNSAAANKFFDSFTMTK